MDDIFFISDDESEVKNIQIVFIRRQLYWDHRFRPVAIRNGLKFPIQTKWPTLARQDPPDAICWQPYSDELCTGVLCDGLRPIDIDLDDLIKADQVTQFLLNEFGAPPIRYRANSSRVLMLYAAAEGEPRKSAIVNRTTGERVEILGRGNQFFADGIHPSGVPVQWLNGSPETTHRDDLIKLTDEQIEFFASFVADLIDADSVTYRASNEPMPTPTLWGDEWPLGDLVDALACIDNIGLDWDFWFKIGASVFNASGGTDDAFNAFLAWSRQCSGHSDAAADRLWRGLHDSPTDEITGGTLYYHAQDNDPDWDRLSRSGFTELTYF